MFKLNLPEPSSEPELLLDPFF